MHIEVFEDNISKASINIEIITQICFAKFINNCSHLKKTIEFT